MQPTHSILPRIFAIATLASIATASKAQEWQFGITPYIWLPNVEASSTTESPPNGAGQPEFETGPVNYLEHLDFVLMLAGEARRGNWNLRADMVYVDFGNQRAAVQNVSGPGGAVERPANANTTSSITGLEVQTTLGYQLVNQSNFSFEVLGGLRYLDLEFDFNWQLAGPANLLPSSGHVSQGAQPIDAIVGGRARFAFADGKLFVPLHADVGTGDSTLTWQLFAGIGYAFSWGDLLLAYRHLEYEQEDGELLESLGLDGPAVGVSFHF